MSSYKVSLCRCQRGLLIASHHLFTRIQPWTKVRYPSWSILATRVAIYCLKQLQWQINNLNWSIASAGGRKNRPSRTQKKKDSTEGRMINDGGGKILWSLLEGYKVMRTNICPVLSLYNRDKTTEFEVINLIIDEHIYSEFRPSEQPNASL